MDRNKTSTYLRVGIDDPPASLRPAAAGPLSPCIRVCKLDEHQVCIGCRRTMDEIVAWPRMSRREKEALLEVLPDRHS